MLEIRFEVTPRPLPNAIGLPGPGKPGCARTQVETMILFLGFCVKAATSGKPGAPGKSDHDGLPSGMGLFRKRPASAREAARLSPRSLSHPRNRAVPRVCRRTGALDEQWRGRTEQGDHPAESAGDPGREGTPWLAEHPSLPEAHQHDRTR